MEVIAFSIVFHNAEKPTQGTQTVGLKTCELKGETHNISCRIELNTNGLRLASQEDAPLPWDLLPEATAFMLPYDKGGSAQIYSV